MNNKNKQPIQRRGIDIPMGAGIALGIALGAALDNIALGLAIGIILGGAGTVWRRKQ